MDIILASKSPRRQELLRAMGFDFEVVSREVDESYSPDMDPAAVPVYLAEKKARAFDGETGKKLLITADTVVLSEGKILGKPAGREEAADMLGRLSGKRHEVITAVALLKDRELLSFSDTTSVFFAPLNAEEILFYVENFQPFDKAGSYGIQEWIGHTKITRIEGSYTNVVGLPTEKLYHSLLALDLAPAKGSRKR
ncbi:MAG TPA: Maf family nucleotide pyrophosphatase [Anseongella sp.]|nr:Maf family nucleotide pyrophosphatase [Anseongella sp.]